MEVGFINNIRHGLIKSNEEVRTQVQDYKETKIERAGQFLVKNVASWPVHIFKFATDRRVLTIAFAALALVATSFAFYPAMTTLVLHKAVVLISKIVIGESIKFGLWSWACTSIIAIAARAFGRFDNKAFQAPSLIPAQT